MKARQSKRHPGAAAGRRLLLAAFLALVGAPRAAGQVNRGTPDELAGIEIEQKLNAQLPLDAEFMDDRGQLVRLGDYFDGRRPVILTLNYYKCPMLCGLLLSGVLEAVKEMDWTIGKEFQIVTVSFDPLEHNTSLPRLKKQRYLLEYGRAAAADGWHFLTGRPAPIKALTEAVGFRYRWNREREEFAHPSAMIICTPDGRVARYLGGIQFDPQVARLSMVEASSGKVGSLWDAVFLTCFHYVSGDGKYTANVMRLMRIGAGLTAAALAGSLLGFWRWEARRRRAHERDGAQPAS